MSKRTLGEKLQMTFGAIIMSPMLFDDPKATKDTAKKTFWGVLKKIWFNEEI